VLDVYTLLFSILISTTGMIHLNNMSVKIYRTTTLLVDCTGMKLWSATFKKEHGLRRANKVVLRKI